MTVSRRRTWAVLLVVAVGALAAWLFVRAVVPATRFIYGLAPIGADEAILLTRRNEDDATYFWAQLSRGDGTVAWSTELSPFETYEALGFSGIAASDDRVVLLGTLGSTTTALGLDRATGEQLWQTEISAGLAEDIGTVLILDGPRVYALHGLIGRPPSTITALALADGSVLWTLDLAASFPGADMFQVASLGPDRLVITHSEGVGAELDGATGALRGPLPLRRITCETRHGIIGSDGSNVVVLSTPKSTDSKVSAQVVDLGGAGRPSREGPCGERDGDVIVGLSDPADDRAVIVRLDPVAGSVRWRLRLEADWSTEVVSADGTLPQFLAVVVHGDDPTGESSTRTIVVDLDAGAIVSQHPHDDHLVAFVTGERAYVMAVFRATVFALDPKTGGLASATRFAGTGGNDVRREDLRFGRLWLFGLGFGKPSALSWGTFDLASGAVSRVSGEVEPSDVTSSGWPTQR
jgi:hypothetical protein